MPTSGFGTRALRMRNAQYVTEEAARVLDRVQHSRYHNECINVAVRLWMVQRNATTHVEPVVISPARSSNAEAVLMRKT